MLLAENTIFLNSMCVAGHNIIIRGETTLLLLEVNVYKEGK